jgi:hypothetical protein
VSVEAIITAALDEARASARSAALYKASVIAAIHSQYPITTDFDRGYARGRRDAADAILREAKDTRP